MLFLSRVMVKLSFIYLIIGTTIGTLLLINKAYLIHPVLWALLPVHIEFLIFGWIIQLTLGVAYWILPRFIGGESRGSEDRAKWMVILFNSGILLVALSQLEILPDQFSLVGRLSESFAVVLFISLHWNRIVSYNK